MRMVNDLSGTGLNEIVEKLIERIAA
jgi:hypothetical protein